MSKTAISTPSTFALQQVSFTVPGRTLLQNVSLTFPQGQVCGLIGHNGSGKSTLLKMLGRHQSPSEGQILLGTKPLADWDSKAFAREVAYLPQQLPAAEGMTVRELVAIGRYPWLWGVFAVKIVNEWKRQLRWSISNLWLDAWLIAYPVANDRGLGWQ